MNIKIFEDDLYLKNIKLWEHQKKLLELCIVNENKYDKISLTEKPGSGKTNIILSLIQYQLLLKSNEKTLIIVNNNIYQQWIDSMENFPLLKYQHFCDYASVSSLMYNNIIDNHNNIFITTPLFYKFLCESAGNQFYRVVIDEIDNISFFINNKVIESKKLWFVSGTINDNLYKELDVKKFFNISLNNYDLNIIEEEVIITECYNKSVNMLEGIITNNELQILNGLDYGQFKSKIGYLQEDSDNENLINIYKNTLDNEIDNINNQINHFKELYNNKKLNEEELNNNINNLKNLYNDKKKTLDKMTQRLKEEKICLICFDDINLKSLICNLCCSSIYCKKCIKIWANSKKTCPHCRSNVDYSIFSNKYSSLTEYLSINQDKAKVFDNSSKIYDNYENLTNQVSQLKIVKENISIKWNSYKKTVNLNDKIDTLLKIVQDNKDKKIIIFNSFSASFSKTIAKFNKNNILDYLIFNTGNLEVANESINKFKKGNYNKLLLDGMYNSHGLNFENCEVLILMHKMDDDKEKQMIARAQRPGRKNKLFIHKLYYDNELNNE